MGDIFRFVKGRRLTKEDMIEGDTNYLGAIGENNGVRQHIQVGPGDISAPNCIIFIVMVIKANRYRLAAGENGSLRR